ncbi:MAG: inorganic pyrophosphatase Ppa [Spirochaetes bacterium]|nr:inorganic pyrophosphatase Ppa [Spirochaetota bacterium]
MADSYIRKLIEKSEKKFAVEKFHDADARKSYRSFIGTPKKHPKDENILILLTDPFSKNTEFYEFAVDSIASVEEIDTITNEDGESAMKVRLWIKKGMPAIKAKPFIVR